ncbi:Na+/H+ antiporter NhaA [Mycoplana dimorpha]|uniref:Na(+)/H(+) antiporter NhaA n=1 Tax=Mycoplana dimorpha TaxID=28320 RepID=A0A2T5B538_MYCDI|nr:Na+/H+ antiporter NhaA [Mycoplana dimorpha]PTM94108.1 sodium/proton antiporter (NhaA family) [Mycoplana dimorpha]
MSPARPTNLDRPVDANRDHLLGSAEAEMVLVEYGSYVSASCRATHQIVRNLRDRFGAQMSYVFRHFPGDSENGRKAAELAEYAFATSGEFWPVHSALMRRGPGIAQGDLDEIAADFDLPPPEAEGTAWQSAERNVQEDAESGQRSGVVLAPTFFINGRRYEGAWDEHSLSEAMLGSVGHRIQTASLDFVRWGPSAGIMLLLMSVLAVGLTNSRYGPAFEAFWQVPFGVQWNDAAFSLPLLDWINLGLLTVFFLIVGLEIKREFTVGRLAAPRAAALPIAASFGGMIVPALIFLAVVPAGPLMHGWGTTISTDTAFAIALIVFLGDRVPVELRVFLTAVVIVDDLVAIVVVALFYSGHIDAAYLVASAVIVGCLVMLNRWGVYRVLPYAVLGTVLWFCVHQAGLHATLAGVVLAMVIPTRPPANLHALMAQAETVVQAVVERPGEASMRHGLPEPALRALDAIHARIESPAARVLRTVEPWSSYMVLPAFALANAGVALSLAVVEGHAGLMLATILGLVVGKPLGITLAAWLAVRLGIAIKPDAYTWRQLLGAGALAGIGFTMSLFIAGQAFASPADFAAAKIAIFAASVIAGVLGVVILWKRPSNEEADGRK